MTLENFSEEFDIGLVFAIFIICMVVSVIAIIIKKAANNDDSSTTYSENNLMGTSPKGNRVRIVSKRSVPHEVSTTIMINMVTFEFLNRSRIELIIPRRDIFDSMREGDVGYLEYLNQKFIRFTREF